MIIDDRSLTYSREDVPEGWVDASPPSLVPLVPHKRPFASPKFFRCMVESMTRVWGLLIDGTLARHVAVPTIKWDNAIA